MPTDRSRVVAGTERAPGEALYQKLIAEACAERRVEEGRRGALEAFAKLRGEGGEAVEAKEFRDLRGQDEGAGS
jgi:hypothetical protein